MRIGSLCSGYEGLGMAVQSVLGGELAWVADIDPGASAILAHRFPSVPNLSDISKTDWSAIEPVDVLTAGFPCQDVSCAGGRAGLREGNRTGVWAYVARAISELRPSLVVLENVRGLLSAGADSDLEQCPWCLGESGMEHALRASGAVFGDLADLGFDAEGIVVSAAEAGAPHRRERVFILAWPAADTAGARRGGSEDAGAGGRDARERSWGGQPERDCPATAEPTGVRLPLRQPEYLGRGSSAATTADGRDTAEHDRLAYQGSPAAENADRTASRERRQPTPGQAAGGRSRADAGGPGGASAIADAAGIGRQRHHEPPPIDSDGQSWPGSGTGNRGALADAERAELAREPQARRREVRGTATAGRGPGTPADAERGGRDGRPPLQVRGQAERAPAPRDSRGPDISWGAYELAIRRWERATGRPAPRPTEPGRTGERLSPRFVEWMMGLPEGWVTDVPSLSRNAQLKALGNGVVPAQAAMALRMLLGRSGLLPLVAADLTSAEGGEAA